MIVKTILFLFVALLDAAAEEKWTLKVDDSGKGYLTYRGPDGRRQSFSRFYLENDQISDEVVAIFKKDDPQIWESAVNSSGNLHNPALVPLQKKFSQVLLKTATVRRLDEGAKRAGYRISAISFEKFFLIKEQDRTRIHAFLWPKFEKMTATSSRE